MAYVFVGLPADSSDLETLHGYVVARRGRKPVGAALPPREAYDPWAEPDELELAYAAASYQRPAVAARPAAAPAPRRARPVARRFGNPFPATGALASLLIVPGVCFGLVRLIGLIPM
ncbi:MAG: hypothetical protein KF754_01935 [Planctomycetes bacterium]|nr:hypothetical protein [Planctomycetota bacterium]